MPVKVVELPRSTLEQAQAWIAPFIEPLATAGMIFVLVVFILLHARRTAQPHHPTFRLAQLARDDPRDRRCVLSRDALSPRGGHRQRHVRRRHGPRAVAHRLAQRHALGPGLRFSSASLPYIGPWIAAGLPILLSLAVFDGWAGPLWVVGAYIFLEITISYTLEPWLYGASIGITSIGVIFAAIFWTWLWGPIGLVLAMPLTVCLVVAAEYVPSLRFLAILLGDRVGLKLSERFYQRLWRWTATRRANWPTISSRRAR